MRGPSSNETSYHKQAFNKFCHKRCQTMSTFRLMIKKLMNEFRHNKCLKIATPRLMIKKGMTEFLHKK